ncbi:Adenylate kinase [Thermovirga lienii DSM 17291]|jgi:adenylate kinase|uniref:Adenylate kinase n=1 Tax=Thermovirga lienii (strain ATCC BAA-1197 / DSM 17291 / Cas60314) TaxID=580340 RepID=G7V8W1_THELD|nr:adenylate kinase [Thermovirga lienii]AER66402.1 Adenylate kinase [Thermovirga lienii DSM 17291]MDN5318957.1 adenylate kinase [Thermovirga sp.]MDN5368594.1 adenylate kinase [Thermovirga sp.]HCD72460.1 adenylate kinase [Thermovirga lienii]
MKLIFLGPPGAGKGTQAAVISKKYGIAHISTGDILRDNVARETELGLKAKKYMESGQLVPDDVIVDMVERRLKEEDCRAGFILDGFPRTVVQAEALDKLLEKLHITLDGIVYFDVPDDVVIKRLSGRRICKSCGAIYNIHSQPPKKEGVCDLCGGELYQRSDDEESVVRNRLKVYKEQTAPLISYYEKSDKFLRVDASQDSSAVVQAIVEAVKK